MSAQAKTPDPINPPEGLTARIAALALIQTAVLRRGGLDDALSRPSFTGLEPRERAFARALAGATLRHLGPIDALLQPRLQKAPPEAILWLLRLGTAQLFFMDVAVHAAVSVTVDQAAASPATRPFKGLVNAVLRALLRDPAPVISAEQLVPAWLFARWRAAFGEATALAIAEEVRREPPTDLSFRDSVTDADLQALEGERTATGGLRTQLRGDIADWPGFTQGRWWIQDASAALPARLLDARPGERVLDLCAAPGGKTLQLAATGADVTALDRSASRLKRLGENLQRTGLKAEVVVADGGAWRADAPFDAILLDAPCSATGTFRRHPDVLWAARPSDLATLCALQARLLDAAAAQLKPGGRLVYCVCSLEPEEGEAQVDAFLERHAEFARSPVEAGEGGAPARAITPEGAVRLLPGAAEPELGGDGFYIARLQRRG